MTLLISVLGMAVAIVIGLAVALVYLYAPRPASWLARGYVELFRGTPLLIQLYLIFYGLPNIGVRLSPLVAAVFGLGLNYAAYESEIYRGALQAVPQGQLDAARALGLTDRQALMLVRGPQALRLALAPMTNDFVALLKDSSLVSIITVVELTKQTSIFAANIGSWVVPGAMCAALYLAMSLPLARLARRIEKRWQRA
jgi:polar amino acid transport system substrate-binding protein